MRIQSALGAAALASAGVASLAAAQSTGDQRSYPVGAFDKVTGAGANHFIVTVGGAASVRASGPSETLDRYEVKVEGRELKIVPKEPYRHDGSLRNLKPATYLITLPRISAATLAGSGDMAVDRVDNGSFAATLAGSGNLSVGRMDVETAKLTVAGSGDLSARGKARSSNVSIAGSGSVRARDLRSQDASVSVAGSGDTALGVTGKASISIVGSGDVAIAGTTRCSVTRMGSGKANCSA